MVLNNKKIIKVLEDMTHDERRELRNFLDEIFLDLRSYIDENDLAGEEDATYPLLIEWDDGSKTDELLYTRDMRNRLMACLKLIREINEKRNRN
jgi:hypothetical protein